MECKRCARVRSPAEFVEGERSFLTCATCRERKRWHAARRAAKLVERLEAGPPLACSRCGAVRPAADFVNATTAHQYSQCAECRERRRGWRTSTSRKPRVDREAQDLSEVLGAYRLSLEGLKRPLSALCDLR